MEHERFLNTMVFLLQREVEALRSVLSEYSAEHSQYVQWICAEDLRRVIEGMEHRLYHRIYERQDHKPCPA